MGIRTHTGIKILKTKAVGAVPTVVQPISSIFLSRHVYSDYLGQHEFHCKFRNISELIVELGNDAGFRKFMDAAVWNSSKINRKSSRLKPHCHRLLSENILWLEEESAKGNRVKRAGSGYSMFDGGRDIDYHVEDYSISTTRYGDDSVDINIQQLDERSDAAAFSLDTVGNLQVHSNITNGNHRPWQLLQILLWAGTSDRNLWRWLFVD